MKYSTLIPVVGMMTMLVACDTKDETQKAPPVRPVLSMIVTQSENQSVGFAGTIQPKVQTERGFQVLGRLIYRYVEIGDIVKAGQKLAELDPLLLDLIVRSNQAELAKAESQLTNAMAAEARTKTLLEQKVVSSSELDTARSTREVAAAKVQQAKANLTKAQEQRGYAVLTADIDGVITSIDAEVGQTVSEGSKVMTIAGTDVREAVIDLPEDVARTVSIGTPFKVRLQTAPTVKATGKVREIAPKADASTRTQRVKITLEQPPLNFRLGATITALPVSTVEEKVTFDIPISALLERDGAFRVWLLDEASKTVNTVPVQVEKNDGSIVRITNGLSAGVRIVTAGVHQLSEGQLVKIDERASR
jgi:RND family efflux transporter MFP subunit